MSLVKLAVAVAVTDVAETGLEFAAFDVGAAVICAEG
jgi:hypothetical protein